MTSAVEHPLALSGDDLPDELWLRIFSLCANGAALRNASEACRRFRAILAQPSAWESASRRLADERLWRPRCHFFDCEACFKSAARARSGGSQSGEPTKLWPARTAVLLHLSAADDHLAEAIRRDDASAMGLAVGDGGRWRSVETAVIAEFADNNTGWTSLHAPLLLRALGCPLGSIRDARGNNLALLVADGASFPLRWGQYLDDEERLVAWLLAERICDARHANADGITALMICAARASESLTAWILDSAERPEDLCAQTDARGRTALMFACWRGYQSVSEALLRHSPLHAVDADGCTALHHAGGHAGAMLESSMFFTGSQLIEAGANPYHVCAKHGYTFAHHMAAGGNSTGALSTVLDNLAQLRGFKDTTEGLTPWELYARTLASFADSDHSEAEEDIIED